MVNLLEDLNLQLSKRIQVVFLDMTRACSIEKHLRQANLPSKFIGFKSLISQATYPSWKPKIQFDYIMLRKSELKSISSIKPIKSTATGISDHTPIGVEIQI